MQKKLYNDYHDLEKIDNNEEAIKNSIKNILTTRIGTLQVSLLLAVNYTELYLNQ